MIRPAYAQELEICVSMAREFWQHTYYDDPFDDQYVYKMVELAYRHELLIVLEVHKRLCGFAAGVAIPLLGNAQVTQVTELAYWVNPESRGHGLKLIEGFEKACRMVGAKYVNMIAMQSSSPEVAEKIYLRRGYTKIETTYCKKLEDESWVSPLQL